MHEASIAKALLETILTETEKVGPHAVPATATISCGTFDAVNDDLLQEAFAAAARDTTAEKTKLYISHIPVRAKCRNCEKLFNFDIASPACPDCGSDFDLMPDHPLTLDEIEFETE